LSFSLLVIIPRSIKLVFLFAVVLIVDLVTDQEGLTVLGFFICCILLKNSGICCDLSTKGQSFCICNSTNVFVLEKQIISRIFVIVG
jgi:hypothetical protein